MTEQAATITAGINEEGNRTLSIMLAAMGGLFVVGLAGAGYLNRHVLIRPIQRLAAGTRAVAGGDLTAHVQMDRGDEIGALAESFNTMVEQLRSRNETLSERESQYRSVFEATSDGLLLFTVGGELVEANPACCEMHGYSREEFLQLPPASFIHGDDLPLFENFLAAVATGAEFRTRARDIRKDGSHFPIEVLGRPFASMGRTLLMAVIRDITDQVETERVLEERVEARTRELDALLRADAELYRSLDLDEVLQALVDVAVDVLGAHKSLVSIWDDERGQARVRAVRNISPESIARLQEFLTKSGHTGPAHDFNPTVYQTGSNETMPPEMRAVSEEEGITATMDIPIRSPAGSVMGGFGVAYSDDHIFSDEEQRVLLALADRAAVAIENAALYEKAQEAASLEERQRLARELHDSVSQALYGIALGARTARTLLDQDAAKAKEPVDYVLSLAEAGLAEMRALIFELRPESLEAEGVAAALEKQVAATRARFGIAVEASLGEEPDAPIEVKEALYRIGQEALNNVVKHASAQHASVSLRREGGAIVLEVRDDGIGFDPDADYAGHLGLRSMRERVAEVSGTLTLTSQPGHGSLVIAAIPVPQQL